jgi:Protein of unknown function (DUF664)
VVTTSLCQTRPVVLVRPRAGRKLRARPAQLLWDESDPNSDMFARPDESRDFITGLYRRAWAHADATIEALPLDAVGHVPWWPAGLAAANSNLPPGDRDWWRAHRDRVERAAQEAAAGRG